ncbi:hypothetical protein BC827DRAFT_1155102 [Russula dissimulans]|nr:hypothetical protein BC827DRAFT_1155102 [Russula dissimulans]
MSASPPQGLFKPAHQAHSLATLVLIENSAAMVDRWPDLRDRYIPTLLGTVRKVNPVVPIHVLFLTSCPVSSSEEAIALPNSSRYHHLPEVRFSQQPNNKITVATLLNATDILATSFSEANTTRHLFVIAASGPPSESVDVLGADPQTGWQALCSKLTKAGLRPPTCKLRENIHLHMVLNPNVQESENFTQLFYNILAMQQFQEAATWFRADTENYRFHLSMHPYGHQDARHPFPSAAPHRTPVVIPGTASAVSATLLTPTSGISGLSLASPLTDSFSDESAPPYPSLTQPPQRIPLPRNNSFPPAGANGRPTARSTAASSINNSPPPSIASVPSCSDAEPAKLSIVKHLQKIHGLTKKRNYGLHTSRAPFFRDETTPSSPFPSAQSVDPVNGRPRRNTGVHASKNKRGDDPRRPRRGSVNVGLPQAESMRVSSPESDSSTSVGAPSPTATVAGVLASPAGPVTVGLQMGVPSLSSPPLNLGEVGYANAPPPPLWQQSEALGPQAAAPVNSAPAFTEILPPHQQQRLVPPQGPALPATTQVQTPQAQAQIQAQVQRTHVHITAPLTTGFPNVPHGNADPTVAYSTTMTAPAVGSSFSFVSQQSSAFHTTPPAVAAPVPAPPPQLTAASASASMTTDDGDKPFIFYPEYEESLVPQPPPLFAPLSTTAAHPATVAHYWPTAGGDYSHILNPVIAPGLLRANLPPVYDVPVFDLPAHSQPAHPHLGTHMQPGVVYASEQSSSLQSWAGY